MGIDTTDDRFEPREAYDPIADTTTEKLEQARVTFERSAKSNRSKITESMKLNHKLPKAHTTDRCPRAGLSCNVLKSLVTLALLVSINRAEGRHQQIQESSSSNEISHQPSLTNYSHLTRNVTDLRLISDLRSIQLRWNYVQPNTVSHIKPAVFEIRYCELTSWMAEIKCRHRNVPVVGSADDDEAAGSLKHVNHHHPHHHHHATNNAIPNSVISQVDQQQEQQLDAVVRPVSSEPVVVPAAETTGPKSAIAMISSAFETNIYDLRALTNYTFDVHVARFTGEPQLSTYPATSGGHGDGSVKLNSAATSGGTRLQQRPGRRLDVGGAHNAGPNELLPSVAGWPDKQQPYRVETKPFQAEALKCLANSSEVLINTGRYFGGRISVESQPFDSRCQLVGNKSSSQTSYLLRIDHELCRSKVIDSNRIETMILVHENKDILTHNTARFLVQCNIMQKSFTVKASVSLPKILNHQQQQQTRPGAASFRPATITMLSGRPVGAASQQAETNPVNQARLPPQPMQEQQVRLGSMPGVYRSIRAGGSSNSGSSNHADTEPARWSLNSTDEHRPIATTAEAESQLSPRIALPAPASDGDSVGGGARSANSSGRRSKELLAHESRFRDTIQLATGDNYRLELPKPVEVSSKVLFVARAANNDNSLVAPLPVARQRGARNGLGHWDRMTAPAGSLANGSVALTVESDGEGSVGQPARLLAATGDGSSHNHHNHNHKSPQKQQSPMATDERSRSSPVTVGNEHHTANGDDGDDSKVSLADQLMTQPIIMRNNHRVAGGFPSLARMITAANQQSSPVLTSTSAKQTDPAADFSIRYSTTKVDEYSLDADSPTPTANKTGQELQPLVVQPVQARSRSGRMRQIVSTAPSTVSLPSIDHKQQQQHALGRMGDAMPQQQDLIGAESAPQNEFSLWPQARDNDSPTNDATATKSIMTADSQPIANTTTTTVNPTLAQNITGALIRWSLKTLGNLARKSLESLVDERDLVATGSGNQSSDLEWNKVQRHGERLRDGFLLVDDGRESSGGHKESAAATIITAPPRQTPRIQPSTTTSSNGLLQQHVRTATQSADLVQSRAPHHLEPPPLLRAGGSSSSRQATTVALATVPSDSVTTPSSIRTTSTTTTTTTRAPTVQAQRQHKSHSSNNNQQQQQPHSEQQQQQHHSARIRTHHGDESTNSLQLLRAIDSQAKESGTPSGGGSSSYWPIYVLWGLIGSVALLMLVIYFVAFASSTSPQMFKPSSARHYNEATAGNSRRSQPRLGFLAQLNDAIYRNHHHHSSSWPDGPAGMRQNTAKGLQQQQQHSVDTIDHLLDNSEVRSPNAQRRRNNQNLQSQSQNHNHNKHSNNHSTPKDTGALIGSGPSLASPCDFGSATSTRSTSAASTANLSATLAASSLDLADHQQDRQQDENYCKNHEQFVYSDYLLLNKSDCLANECGRNESFA